MMINWSETRAFECEFDDEVWSKYWERWKFKTELDESLNNCEFWNNSKSLSRLDTCTIIIGNIVIAKGEVGNPDIHRKHHQNYHHWKYQHCDHPETGRLSTCTPSASDYKPPALPWTLKTGDFSPSPTFRYSKTAPSLERWRQVTFLSFPTFLYGKTWTLKTGDFLTFSNFSI